MPELDLDPWQIDVGEAIALSCAAAKMLAFAVSPKISNSEGANTSIQQSRLRVRQQPRLHRRLRHHPRRPAAGDRRRGPDATSASTGTDSRRDPAELMAAEDVGRLARERAWRAWRQEDPHLRRCR